MTASTTIRTILVGLGLLVPLSLVTASQAMAGNVYTVANYPVEGAARNAVEAKRDAIENGQKRALRSLLKRLVPVTGYPRLAALEDVDAAALIDGYRVRRESNSSTEYIAVYDFTFRDSSVRSFLRDRGLGFLDRQSEPILLLPIFSERPQLQGADQLRGVDGASAATQGAGGANRLGTNAGQTWHKAWTSLDLENSLTPLQVSRQGERLSAAVRAGLLAGESGAIRALSEEIGVPRAVVAYLEPTADGSAVTVILAGRDAVGEVFLQRRFMLDPIDSGFTFEMASVIGLGILEGRWKAKEGPRVVAATGAEALAAGAERLALTVRFSGLGEWQQIRTALSNTSGVDGLSTDSLARREARVSLSYPGGVARLSSALAGQGLRLVNQGGDWVVTR